MVPVINPAASKTRVRPRVLVVDDEPGLVELVRDIVERESDCRILSAADIATAQRILATDKVDLLLADVNLPDGNGMTLLPKLREKQPTAAAVVITGKPSVDGAIDAFRAGVVDFLPKPFSANQLIERVRQALKSQAANARNKTRLERLRGAVKKLNVTRHTISKKVDLLCNDLVSAYGELSRQLDAVRQQESFRQLLNGASDLEQMLCHAMDWLLRQAGYCNVAVWLASDEQDFELGAYMKYTIAGEPELTDAMKLGLVPTIVREGYVHLFGPELHENLTGAEFSMLAGQEIVGVNCTYLGESLATLILFRDEKSPFSDEDVSTLRAISPIFAVALANMVRRSQGSDGEDDGGALLDDNDNPSPKSKNDADWWKRGEPPPF
jgi:DNA-binding response OmpR family regulator